MNTDDDKSYEKNLLSSIKLQYLQLAELECQALAEEAGFKKESQPRKVIFNSREEEWDFRSDIELPWFSEKHPPRPSEQDPPPPPPAQHADHLKLSSTILTASKNISARKSNFGNNFV